MSEPRENDPRLKRAATITELLRLGHDPGRVAAAVNIADAGGSVYDAMAALNRDARAHALSRAARAVHRVTGGSIRFGQSPRSKTMVSAMVVAEAALAAAYPAEFGQSDPHASPQEREQA